MASLRHTKSDEFQAWIGKLVSVQNYLRKCFLKMQHGYENKLK